MAELVPACKTLADVGTDHGFLPLYLLKTNKIDRAICADINAAPLDSARRNFAGTGLEGRADFRLGNGMQVIGESEIDIAVIAGMGGETIAELLAADKSRTPIFVLQPMSKPERLRVWLAENGFGIDAWNLVQDAGRLYEVLRVSRGAPVATEPFVRFGAPGGVDPELYGQYVRDKIAAAKKSLRGLSAASAPDSKKIAEAENDLKTLDKIQDILCKVSL